jgi:hypothetical protein
MLFGILGLGPAIGAAQTTHAGAGHAMDDERMFQMMKMMGEMGRMRSMMEEHRGQMMKQCPGAAPSAAPTK